MYRCDICAKEMRFKFLGKKLSDNYVLSSPLWWRTQIRELRSQNVTDLDAMINATRISTSMNSDGFVACKECTSALRDEGTKLTDAIPSDLRNARETNWELALLVAKMVENDENAAAN